MAAFWFYSPTIGPSGEGARPPESTSNFADRDHAGNCGPTKTGAYEGFATRKASWGR